jgi:hypothetical protein
VTFLDESLSSLNLRFLTFELPDFGGRVELTKAMIENAGIDIQTLDAAFNEAAKDLDMDSMADGMMPEKPMGSDAGKMDAGKAEADMLPDAKPGMDDAGKLAKMAKVTPSVAKKLLAHPDMAGKSIEEIAAMFTGPDGYKNMVKYVSTPNS